MVQGLRRAARRPPASRRRLYTQALHELDLPRRYQTIIAVGVFGLGTTRERGRPRRCARLRAHLVPGGTLAVDIETAVDGRTGSGGAWAPAARPTACDGGRPSSGRCRDGSAHPDPRRARCSFDPLDQSRTTDSSALGLLRERARWSARRRRELRHALVPARGATTAA